ncbi:MAG: hypothetical protein SNJ82_06330 [Gemmataceae bacterium]
MVCVLLCWAAAPIVLVAEAERFEVQRGDWKPTPQDFSYASHTYGGMWVSQGGLLGAPADSDGAIARTTLAIPEAGDYRVWSKYQAPPYFQYPHRVEILQNDKIVFSHVYGKNGTPRLWSFSGESDELWWFWGVDHDAAEAPKTFARLAKGTAELRLTTLQGEGKIPSGARFIDFIVLTTEPTDTYRGFKPYAIGSPFLNEALDATRLYARFENPTAKPAKLTALRAGHLQPQYGGATKSFPEADVPPGQWSVWFEIGSFCRLAHDEGLTLKLPGAARFRVQFARDPAGKDSAGEVIIDADSGAAIVPIDVTWNPKATVKTSKTHALELIRSSKSWRRASPTKPKQIRFYGAFSGSEDWVSELKHTLGYNTVLPEKYPRVLPDIVHVHYGSEDAIRALGKKLTPEEKKNSRVVSFGDEIGLGRINYADPKMNEAFRAWLASNKVTAEELGLAAGTLPSLTDKPGRLAWYSNRFNERERFGAFRAMTQAAREAIGPHVLTGANYSPHHLALCYGPVYQWVDIFRAQGMSMFWTEDYIFSVPEVPNIISWQFAQIHAAVREHGQPIHFYVMPHAPGQLSEVLRRNMLFAVGSGSAHIDNFWVGPPERFTENYVSYHHPESYRALYESIYDTAAVEPFLLEAKRRKGSVALILSQATDYHESRSRLKKEADPFFARCKNAPATIEQTLGRKEQQYLYLALREAGYDVDLLTEDDVIAGRLAGYAACYLAGEWVQRGAIAPLSNWVEAGGQLYVCGGLGQRNEFDENEPGMLALLGLKNASTSKTLIAPRTLLELPLAEPIGHIIVGEKTVPFFGLRQHLEPGTATVLHRWKEGQAAVTVQKRGKGQAIAVGGLPGMAWIRSGLKPIPYARGGRGTFYFPSGYNAAAHDLVLLGTKDAAIGFSAQAGAGIETLLLDSKAGTLLTLVNWSDRPAKDRLVRVRVPFAPKSVRDITSGTQLKADYAEGVASFRVTVSDATFVTLTR